jgi:hypothetical protein
MRMKHDIKHSYDQKRLLQLIFKDERKNAMLIDPTESELFFKLYMSLLGFTAGRAGSIAGIRDLASFRAAPKTAKGKVRDHLYENIHLINDYIETNPDGFREQELGLVSHWTRFLKGDFVVARELKPYTLFLLGKDYTKAYGVLGLSDEIADILPLSMPVMIRAVLLPWKGQIIWDGLFTCYSIHFGRGIQREFKESYQRAKESGIILSLDPDWKPLPPKPKSKPKIPAISRFLKKCPTTLAEFKSKYGPPRKESINDAACEYCLWSMDGKPAIDIDTLLIYPNVLRKQVLYVYGKEGIITHISVVDPMRR